MDLMSASGFLIGCLTGIYNANAGNLQLEFRGLCGGEQLERFGEPELSDERHMFYWDMYDIRDLPRQLSAMMPNRIPMREPYRSIYLMCLARSETNFLGWTRRNELTKMVFAQGIGIDETGRLVIEQRGTAQNT